MKEDKEKHAGGRPKEAFKPWENWEADILNLYSKGASDVEIRGLIIEKSRDTLSYDLWDRWLTEEGKFSKTIKEGRILSQIWWEKTGREHVIFNDESDKINSTLWFMNVKNRFPRDWRDKVETEHSGEIKTITILEPEFDEE